MINVDHGLYHDPYHSHVHRCILATGPVRDQDGCWASVIARQKESTLLDGTKPGSYGCVVEGLSQGIVAADPLTPSSAT